MVGEREAARGDRQPGLAALQAVAVHRDVGYDVAVDTTRASAETCARTIVTALRPA